MRAIALLVLLGLSVLDFSPFPVVGLVAIGIVLTRPAWFLRVVLAIYDQPCGCAKAPPRHSTDGRGR
ncbi:protein of unknown function [Candidatus Methylocalor cossyra]|uniref:Uncharacterized protein n=1 Tax=Candidatus Methylocalor cossyra TaxID=3108543 RepID=A0ABM9NF36_9GAMM